MTEIVQGIRLTADGKQIVAAAGDAGVAFRKMGQHTAEAASEAAKLNEQQRNLATTLQSQTAWYRQTSAEVQKYTAGMFSAGEAVQKILNRYDPLGTKLRSLQADFAALNKAAASGEIGAGQDLAVDKAYKAMNEEIAKTKILMTQAGAAGAEGFGKASSGAISTAFSTAQARRELIVLGHEAMTGNFSRMPGSFLVLAERAKISGGAIFSVVAPLAAVIGTGIGLIKIFHDAAQETESMNRALAVTNDYAGITRGGMRELAKDVSSVSTLTVGTSKEIVTQLVNSGRIGAQSIGAVAKLADDYATATGRDIAKIGPDLVKLFEDPARGAAELNKQMHFLSPTELEHISHLERIGELDAAQLELAKRLSEQLPKKVEQIGYVERAWNAVKQAASGAYDAMLGVGRPKTLEEQLAAAQADVAQLSSGRPGLRTQSRLAAAQARVEKLQFEVDLEKQGAILAGEHANEIAKQAKAQSDIDKSATHQLVVLQDQLALVKSATGQNPVDQARRVFEINKQIEDLQRSMGAEGRALAAGSIADATRLFNIENKSAVENLDAQLKLGTVTKQQHDAQILAIDLEAIARKKADDARLLALGGLTKLQKQNLVDEMAALDAEAKARQQKYDNSSLIERNKLLQAQADADAKSSAAMAIAQAKISDSLDAQIEKLTRQNEAIGKTKAQVDELAAAETDRRIALIEQYAVAEREDNENSPLLDYYNRQIAKLKEIRALQSQGAVLEASAAVARKNIEAAKRFDQDLQRSLVDSIFRGFEAGKGIAENFRDSLVNMFKTTILTPVIKWVVSPLTGAVTAALGGLGIPGLANAAGGGGALSTLSGGASLLQMLGGSIGGSFGAGLTYAGSSGVGIMGGLAEAFSGGGSLGWSLGAAMPAIGIGLGALSLLGAFGGSGGGPASFTGIDVNANLSRAGAGLNLFGTSRNSDTSFSWPTFIPGNLQQTANAAVAAAFGQFDAFAKNAGYDTSALAGVSANVSFRSSAHDAAVITQDLTNNLGALTDQMAKAVIPNIQQYQQANETLTQTFVRIASQQHELNIQLMDARGQTAEAEAARRADILNSMDETLRVTQQLIWSAQDAAKAQQDLAAAQDKAALSTSSLQSAIQGLPGKLGITSLRQAQNSLALSDALAPLDRLANARKLLDSTYSSAMAGDLSAVNAFPQLLQSGLSVARDVGASGPVFQEFFAKYNRELNDLLSHQRDIQNELLSTVDISIQQASEDNVTTLRKGFADMVTKLNEVQDEVRRLREAT